MRKSSRITTWIICLILAAGLFLGENFIRENFLKEKTPLYVYAPEDMEEAFKRPLKFSGMKIDYKIVITNQKENANIIIENGKEFDSEYTKIAFSPFVVACSNEDSYYKKLKKTDVLSQALFDDSYYDINVLKIIDEVIAEGKWANLGVEDLGDIKVFYPHEDTPYWSDFYDFMLVTVNGGKYPETEQQLQNAIDKIEKFEDSNYTEAVRDFDEQLVRNGGFLQNTLFFIPEKLASDLASKHSANTRIFYPLTTVYFNYYIKVDELSSKMVEYFDEKGVLGSFYDYMVSQDYRNIENSKLVDFSSEVYSERDAYNVLNLEKNRIKPADIKTSD